MNDAKASTINNTRKRGRGRLKLSTPRLEGDVSFVRIPVPPDSAFNSGRAVSSLIKTQLKHIELAESARLPKHKRTGIDIEGIRTEAEAASYIAAVTKLLHPQRRKRIKPRPRT
jgi:hypothetical protein